MSVGGSVMSVPMRMLGFDVRKLSAVAMAVVFIIVAMEMGVPERFVRMGMAVLSSQ